MAGKIPQSFIDRVLNQTDIVDLIQTYVELKPKGGEYSACCPFHGEKTPSFTVSPDKQFYHCFGCGAHGTAINFLMEHEGLQFIEAIELLAERLGLQIEQQADYFPQQEQRENYQVLETASQYFQQQLRNHPVAIEYLKARGINGESASRFNIGYAPPGFDNLKSYLSGKYPQQTLVNNGLLSEKSNGHVYDRFRHRIIFPIKDPRGRVVAFGARAMDDNPPKYINSPETELFHKSSTLYGVYEARQVLGKLSQLVIVEGYMDVIALSQHDIPHCVATLGTATTSQNVRNLLRLTSDLIFCFDGDRAGKDAAWKALQNILPEFKDGTSIRFAFMPTGEDPDSLIRSLGKTAFNEYLTKATPLSEYFFTNLVSNIDMSTADGRAKLANLAQPLLARLPKTVFRDLMYQELNRRVGANITAANPARTQSHISSKIITKNTSRTLKYTKSRLAIALLIRDPQLAQHALTMEELSYLQSMPGIKLFARLLEIIDEDPNISAIALVERFHNDENYRALQKLLMWDPPDMENRELSFKQTMQRFKEDIRKIALESFIQQENT